MQKHFYSVCIVSHTAEIQGNKGWQGDESELKSHSSRVVCETIKVKAIVVGISGAH